MILYGIFLLYLISHLFVDFGCLLTVMYSWNMVSFELLGTIVIEMMESFLGHDCWFWCMFGLEYLPMFSYLLVLMERGILMNGLVWWRVIRDNIVILREYRYQISANDCMMVPAVVRGCVYWGGGYVVAVLERKWMTDYGEF